MISRSRTVIPALLGAAMTVVLVSGCGSAGATPTAAPTAAPTATPEPSTAASATVAPSASVAPSGSVASSGSVAPSGSADICNSDLGLPHISASLEDLLPSTAGGVCIEKFSLVLSAYMASTSGGDKTLYTPWLVKFGKTSDDVNLAIASDLSQTVNFTEHAIEVPGVAAATLSSSFADVARAASWQVSTKSIAGKQVLEIIDPTSASAGGVSAGYVYAHGDVLYTIITDDPSLLTEAVIKLP
jgi:hypothetical protein